MHYEMKPYALATASSTSRPAHNKVVLKRESEAIHVGCVTEGMERDNGISYNTATAQCGIPVCYIFGVKVLTDIFIAPLVLNLLRGGIHCV